MSLDRPNAGSLTRATLVAGTLDILSAFLFSGMAGKSPADVLHFVASGPFGDGALHGVGWAIAGLLIHFAIMAMMVAAYALIAPKIPFARQHPLTYGALYGLILWFVMYWIVRPLRWPAMALPAAWTNMSAVQVMWSIGNALFSHVLLVGIPIALILTGRNRRSA